MTDVNKAIALSNAIRRMGEAETYLVKAGLTSEAAELRKTIDRLNRVYLNN